MNDDVLKQRQRALEQVFYSIEEGRLAELKARVAGAEEGAALQLVSGITDPKLIGKLVELHIDAETFLALAFVPLVAVAWADDEMHDEEREAIAAAAAEIGLDADDIAVHLIRSWIHNRPGAELVDAWKGYVGVLCESLDVESRGVVKHAFLDQAHRVAMSAGNHLNRENHICDAEAKVMAELERVFT